MALRRDAYLTESCRNERFLTVAGVKDYPLWEPERQTLVDSLQPHALAKPVVCKFIVVKKKREKIVYS